MSDEKLNNEFDCLSEEEIKRTLKEDSNENIDTNDLSSTLEEDSNANNEEKDRKIKELEDKYLRAYADFENVKKRLEREKYSSLEYANENILKDFLSILDTLESALKSIELSHVKDNCESKNIIKNIENGIQLVIDNFNKVLGKHQVELIPTDGEFDPNIHNAILQVKDENKENGSISLTIQKGYKYKDRLLRPSMVSIVKND